MSKDNHFWWGVSFAFAFMVGMEDWYGVESYITHVRLYWVTMSPWWGFGIAAFIYLAHLWLEDA